MRNSGDGINLNILDAFRSGESAIRGFLRRFFASEEDIDDICQETVTRALEAAKNRVIEDPGAFLFGIARNLMRKELDRKSRSLIDFIDDFTPDSLCTEEVEAEHRIDERRRLMIFAEAVATLPSKCQRVFIMKKVFGYSHKEISDKLNISVSTVEKHVAAGLRRCIDEMENRGAKSISSPELRTACFNSNPPAAGSNAQRGIK